MDTRNTTVTYKDSIIEAMSWLADQLDTVFIGQTITYGGSYLGNTLLHVPESKKIELPVCEEMQMGMTLGMALQGDICVVSLYPRINFLLLALNQLVNHVDKIGIMSEQKMKPRIIIRTSIGPKEPLDGGPQHTGNYTRAVKDILTTVNVWQVSDGIVVEMYKHAYKSGGTWLFVEEGSRFQDEAAQESK